jgi:hypothetical protein
MRIEIKPSVAQLPESLRQYEHYTHMTGSAIGMVLIYYEIKLKTGRKIPTEAMITRADAAILRTHREAQHGKTH